MTVSLSDLLTIPTKQDVIDKFVSILSLAGFPTASWQTGSFLRHEVETDSELHVVLATQIQNIAKGGLIKLAGDIDDAWVDLCAENVFAEERKPAIYTQGLATLTDTGNVGPVTVNDGTFWIANANKSLRYVNVGGGTLPLGGTLSLTFKAETAGNDWNVGNGELTQILTPQPGVTVTNPAQDTGTWITQQGANNESNTALVQRCLDKWSILGSGSNEGAYRYWVTSASSEITSARVYSPGAGSVRIVIRGDAGPVSSTALAAAQAIIADKRPLGLPDVVVLNASVYAQALVGTLYLTSGFDPAAVLAAAQSSVNAFQRSLTIGAKVSREKVIRAILVDGIEDIELTTPSADVTLGSNDVWIPSYSLVTG